MALSSPVVIGGQHVNGDEMKDIDLGKGGGDIEMNHSVASSDLSTMQVRRGLPK